MCIERSVRPPSEDDTQVKSKLGGWNFSFTMPASYFWCEFTLRLFDAHLRCRVQRLNKKNIIFGADTHIIGCIASKQFHVLILFEIKNIKTLK